MPASTLPVHTRRLANGAVLQACHQPWARQAGFCLRVAAGSHDEPRDYPGLAHFFEHLLFLGSRQYAVEQGLMAFVRGCGGQVNATTQARHTDFVCQLPAASLQPALQRLQDMLDQPLLTLAAQRREREVLHAEYQARSQDADSRIDHALGQALAAGHRCADFLAGDRHSLALEQADFQQALHDYHRQHYLGCNMSLVLVGPQPVDALLALGEACLLAMAAGAPVQRTASASMLPLRASRLALQHPRDGLHLGLALELDEDTLEPALTLFLEALHDPAPGGLQAGLRHAGLCQAVQARVIYRHAGQCLLRLDCPGAQHAAGAQVQAELLGWLRRLSGDSAWGERLQAWQQAQAARQAALAPLALAQHLQQAGVASQAATLAALQRLLAHLASGDGLIELCTTAEPLPLWPALGLALHLQALPAHTLPQACLDLRLPDEHSPLVVATDMPLLPRAALRWYAGPEQGGPAALHWRGPCAAPGLSLPARLAALHARIADQANLCQRHGVVMQLRVEPGAWTLALSGPAHLLPASSARLLPLLLAPLQEADTPPAAGLLLRQLLEHLPELGRASAPRMLQGLGVGLGERAQHEVERLFAVCEDLPEATPERRSGDGLAWREAPVGGAESAMLLFCPLPDASAPEEAAWCLLEHCLQEAFYQRLRGELRLGYALFCGFRQVSGQRGLLFGVQSPVCDSAGILAHIRCFLAEQPQRLAGLSAQAFERARQALQLALEAPRSHVEWAEQHWQAHCAGLPGGHDQAVLQAVATLKHEALLHACRQLLAEQGWQVLSNASSNP